MNFEISEMAVFKFYSRPSSLVSSSADAIGMV